MQRGDRVKVDGLVTATQHNGKYGVVTSERLSKDGRVGVKLDGGSEINVKPGNLQLILMDLGGKELKVGTKVVTVAFVEPYPPDLSLIGYVKDFSPDRTMVKCTFTENPPNERQYFVTNIQNLRVAPRQDEEIPLRFAIDIHRPDIMTQKKVVIEDSGVNDLSGIESLTSAVSINLSDNEISFLKKVIHLPPVCVELNLSVNQIASLENVVFVSRILRTLELQENQIKRLDGVKFPDSLTKLDLSFNKITSLLGVVFPARLEELRLDNNPIASIEGVVLPTNLSKLSLSTGCIVSSDFLSKYDKLMLSESADILLYRLKPLWLAMQRTFSHGREPLPEGWEYSGDPSRRADLKVANDKAQAAYIAEKTQASVPLPPPQASPGMAEFLDPDTLEREKKEFLAELYGEHPIPVAAAARPAAAAARPAAAAAARPAAAAAAGPPDAANRLYHQAMTTFDAAMGGPEYGGNKSKTRRRQRPQNKRNKMQRKNKYSRRRRNSKSK